MTQHAARKRYTVVVGIDFEKTGDDALIEALRLAREHPNDELHLVHVVRPFGISPDAAQLELLRTGLEGSRNAMKHRAVALADRLFPEDEWEQDLTFHVRVGDPAEQVHQVAIDYDAHLIVIGNHARRGLERLLLGSVAERLLRISRFPVLVARERDLSDVSKSPHADPARPGESVESTHHVISERVVFGRVGSHISGLL